jgi:hypothetical protein
MPDSTFNKGARVRVLRGAHFAQVGVVAEPDTGRATIPVRFLATDGAEGPTPIARAALAKVASYDIERDKDFIKSARREFEADPWAFRARLAVELAILVEGHGTTLMGAARLLIEEADRLDDEGLVDFEANR